MPNAFGRGAQQFAGAELELRGDGISAWVLTGAGHPVGTLRWDPHTEAHWEIASREDRWRFEWHGRWPRRFFARDRRRRSRPGHADAWAK